MKNEMKKRILTSICLTTLLILSFIYTYILIIILIIFSILTWIEFNELTSKIFIKKTYKTDFLKLLIKAISLIYLTLFSFFIFSGIIQSDFKLSMLYLFCICVSSDVGGLFFGKVFRGKKLTKISPNKTISGTIGSFILSLSLVPIFYYILDPQFNNFFYLLFIAIIVSLICQLGDLFISLLKRKAKVKDTGNILPGHGGVLNRIDGMLFAVPAGMILYEFLIIVL